VAAACLKNEDKLPLRLMFQDEARFGRISDPRSCWAPAPHRPVVNLALVREFRYEYAAVSPWDGCLDFMTAEKMNTGNMSRFLEQVSAAHEDEFILMVLDGASSHKSKELNIRLLSDLPQQMILYRPRLEHVLLIHQGEAIDPLVSIKSSIILRSKKGCEVTFQRVGAFLVIRSKGLKM